MSGGSFDYAYYRTMQFADELETRLDEQGTDPDKSGWTRPIWSPEVASSLRKTVELANYVSKLMKEAEWLYSGDTGEETYLTRVKEINNK
jgi:hypothetical protein